MDSHLPRSSSAYASAIQPEYLTPEQLANRIGTVKPKQLANWRCRGIGPRFTKLGGRIRYALADVLAWEASCKRTRTPNRRRADQ